MSQRSDIDRALQIWMADGPTVMPDRVVDVIADRISVQPQRRSWRLLRRLPMNPRLKIGVAIAAVMIVAVAGWNLVARPSGPGGPTATPSPTPSTPDGTPPPAIPLTEGPLAAGRYWTQPLDGISALTVSFTVPIGWSGFPDWAVLGPEPTDEPRGNGVGFLSASGLFSDPCHWDTKGDGSWPQQGDVIVGPTAADLAEALLVPGRSYTATALPDTTVDGYPAKRVDLQLPADVDFKTCDEVSSVGDGSYWVWGTSHSGGSDLFAQGPGNRFHLWIIDIEGVRMLIDVNDYAATSGADQDAAQRIVDSVTIDL